jgi:serine phosphatase RsbU (regulator of sigma subunit)
LFLLFGKPIGLWPWLALFLIGSIIFYVKNRERLLKERQKVLEDTVDKRTIELKEEKIVVERQNKNIKESIEYAKRIQETILPPDELVKKALPDSFVFYKPKDIVSGDFYYIKTVLNEVIFSVIDCTGHGVPGAFMSIIGHNLLDKIIVEQKITATDQILTTLNQQLIDYLRQEDAFNAVKDGMNLALCSINRERMELNFSGSYNPLYIIRDQNITILKGDKIPIGKSFLHDQQSFHKETYSLKTGDVLYLFTDGFADQKGGPDKKKYFYSRFRELLLSIHALPLEKQKQKLENEMYLWRGDLEQTDDICIIGIRM